MIGVVYYIRQKDKKNNLYVGSTTKSLEERMINHFKAFNDKTKINRNLYESIRSNGGWENFEWGILESVELKDDKDLKKLENDYIKKLGTINQAKSFRTDIEKEFYFRDKYLENKIGIVDKRLENKINKINKKF